MLKINLYSKLKLHQLLELLLLGVGGEFIVKPNV